MLRTLASVAVGLTALVAASVAQAQVAFDWGGDTTSDSGKQTVKFNQPARPGEIIVSFSDRKLYFITAPGIADTYPIAIPREQSRWEGVTSVTQKRENPSWTPTPTMLAENPRLPRWVPGGHPMNPLGNRALYLGSSAYRIHGTDAPWTIGTAASKGCVRLFNKDVADLYPRVKMGAKVTVTWKSYGGGKGNELATKSAPESSKETRGAQSYNTSASLFGFADVDAASPGKSAATDSGDEARPVRKAVERRKRLPADDAADATVEAPAAKAQKQPVRTADRPRRSGDIETGSVRPAETPVTATKADDAAGVAARAEAAAVRAAEAAERAAAAAERVLQSQSKNAVQ